MKKIVYYLIVAASLSLTAVACSSGNDDPIAPGGSDPENNTPQQQVKTDGVFVLNSGKMGSNNSELTYYIPSTKGVSANVFELANGKKMGDTANDMVVYGSKMYIAVTGSAVVFVTDLKGTLLQEVKVAGEGANLSPRRLEAAEGKVYVTYMEGHLGAIDTTSYAVKTVKVGAMPEGVAYTNKKLYVAVSDGMNAPYGKTVAVLDPASLNVTKTIEVVNNPQTFHIVSDRKMYLISWGDYGEIPATLQIINTSTDTVEKLEEVYPTNMTVDRTRGVAYILSSVYDANWNQTITYNIFDIVKDRVVQEFVGSTDIPNGYCIYVNEANGNVYIGTSDYISNGDVYEISKDGNIINKFDTGALNPVCIRFVKN